MLGAAIAAAASCDAGSRHDQRTAGPAIKILGVNVGVNQKLPADGVIQIAFDRYLLPSTVNRQSIGILDGARQPLAADLAPVVFYDPIARTVTLAPPKEPWLTEGQPYSLVLGIPASDAALGGVRAIDGATLFRDQPREYAFLVGPKAGGTFEPAVSFCRDVLPIFVAKCSLSTCHGTGGRSAAGLVLDTTAGVSATALNRIAQGSNTGPLSAQPPSGQTTFGIDMPIIEPGNPGNSWLVYKVDLARPPAMALRNGVACSAGLLEPQVTIAFSPLVPQAQRTTDDSERSVLSDFILGREMPFPVPSHAGYGDEPLTFEERELVRLWIKSLAPGSAVPECGGCRNVAGADASVSDASLPDANASDAGTTDAADAADAGTTDAADASDAADAD